MKISDINIGRSTGQASGKFPVSLHIISPQMNADFADKTLIRVIRVNL
jgi:hypothetical protein